jgi:uncharacterized protein DUF6882
MDAEQFSDFRHAAVHDLMRLNKECDKIFHINSWPRWDYDLERCTLTFSQDKVAKVIATIQVVGTTSITGGTWLWGWANENLPASATKAIKKVRAFGEAERLAELTQSSCADDEYLGWAMTAIAAKILGAKGAYRCPDDNGFVYLLYSSLRFASDQTETGTSREQLECATHGSGFKTYVCKHLVSDPAKEWFSSEADEKNKWPDAWCSACDAFFQQEGEWNERNESNTTIKLLCHHCYERLRSQGNSSVGGR